MKKAREWIKELPEDVMLPTAAEDAMVELIGRIQKDAYDDGYEIGRDVGYKEVSDAS